VPNTSEFFSGIFYILNLKNLSFLKTILPHNDIQVGHIKTPINKFFEFNPFYNQAISKIQKSSLAKFSFI
jgi:hypothetical protein